MKKIGEGSYGKVFAANWGVTAVAVKTIKYESEDKKDAVKTRFEAALSIKPNHPNIIRSFQYAMRDCPKVPGLVEVWIVSELCKLGSLWSQLRVHAFHPVVTRGQR